VSIGEQISLLLFMIIASKGAAGVTGAGLATLAGGLASHRPELIEGVGLIVVIDRFRSEARALTNFAGNAVATVLVGTWTGEIDNDRATSVLNGEHPFDESDMLDEHYVANPSNPRGPRGPAKPARPLACVRSFGRHADQSYGRNVAPPRSGRSCRPRCCQARIPPC